MVECVKVVLEVRRPWGGMRWDGLYLGWGCELRVGVGVGIQCGWRGIALYLHHMAWLGNAWHGKAGQGKAWHDMARHGTVLEQAHVVADLYRVRLSKERHLALLCPCRRRGAM